jgi:hypothetical protein
MIEMMGVCELDAAWLPPKSHPPVVYAIMPWIPSLVLIKVKWKESAGEKAIIMKPSW